MSADVLEDTGLTLEEDLEVSDTGDHDTFSHYVSKDDIVEATFHGKAVRALCGKKWTPTKSPEKYPVCPDCKKTYESMPKE